MGINISIDEADDLTIRAEQFKNKLYPIKELVNGKNIDVNYTFTNISKSLGLQEVQQGEGAKEKKVSIYALLKGENQRTIRKPLSEVVEYFESLDNV